MGPPQLRAGVRERARGSEVKLQPGSAALLLAAAGTAPFLIEGAIPLAVLTGVLLLVCLRAPRSRSRPYLVATGSSALGVFLLWPLLQTTGVDVLWEGPVVPVLGARPSEQTSSGSPRTL